MISVILPTLRATVGPTLESIRRAGTDIEIIVVTAPHIIFSHGAVDVLVKREPKGTVDAINAGFQASTGDVVFLMNDEATLSSGALDNMKLLLEKYPNSIITPHHHPPCNFTYYDKFFAAFPFIHRSVLRYILGFHDAFFDPSYHCFYADPDLSLRAHAHGVPVLTTAPMEATIYHDNHPDELHNSNVEKYFQLDRATFQNKWNHLGEFKDPA